MEYRQDFGKSQDRYINLVNKLADAFIEYNGDEITDESEINVWISENMFDIFDEADESTYYGLRDLCTNPNMYGGGTYEFQQGLINDAVDTVLSKNQQTMKQQIHLNEETLKGMIREAISEYVGEAYGDIRPNTQMMLDYIDDGLVDPKKVLTELLDYVSDDIVGRFMEDNGYTDGYSLEDDEEEMDDNMGDEEFPDGVSIREEYIDRNGDSHGTFYTSGAFSSSDLDRQCDMDDQYRRMELARKNAEVDRRRRELGLNEAINKAIKKIIG